MHLSQAFVFINNVALTLIIISLVLTEFVFQVKNKHLYYTELKINKGWDR